MDYSGMSTLLSCPQKYEYLYIRKKGDDSNGMATKFGSLWHRIMETGDVDQSAKDLLWVDDPTDFRTLEKARLGYERWKDQYKSNHWKVLVTEQPFSVLFPGIKEPYEGRMDAIVEADAGEGQGIENWVGDYKTTSSLLSDWVALYRISNQFKLYYTVAQMCHPELKLAGVVVDVFHVTKGNKSGKSSGERDGVRFYRVFFRYDPAQCSAAIRDYDSANRVRELYLDRAFFPRNTKSCRDFNKACVFLDVCDTADNSLKERILAVMPDNTFDPLRE